MSGTQRFESRFCRFEAPDDWIALGTAGLIEDRAEPPRCGAVVSEVFLEPPRKLEEYAARQRQVYLTENAGAEVVHDASVRLERFREAHLTGYRVPARGGPVLVHQLHVALGPLVCSLTTTAPEGDTRAEGMTGVVAASFEVTAAPWASEIQRVPLTGDLSAAQPRSTLPATALPHLLLAITPPAGWTVDIEAGSLRCGDAHLALRHHGPATGEADQHFANALARIQREGGWTVVSWDRGILPPGRDYWALGAIQESRSTWGPPRRVMRRTVFVALDGVVELDLLAPAADAGARDALLTVVNSLAPLPEEVRRLALRRPWLPECLPGPWREEAPGLFVRAGQAPLTVLLLELPSHASPATIAAASVASLAGDPATTSITRNELVEGLWQRHEAVRLALDCKGSDGTDHAVRANWLEERHVILTVIVRGQHTAEVDHLFASLLEGLRPDMASGRA
jgi:hypothetical protein